MSTFGGLNTAFSGLRAARQGLDVVGQNIANANTDGYTRQRVNGSSIGAVAAMGPFSQGVSVGQGVRIDDIARLGDLYLDARVRASSAANGHATVRAEALHTLETTLREPSENGLSARLDRFWASWQDLANNPAESAPGAVLIEDATAVASELSRGYSEIESQWRNLRERTDDMVTELNSTAAQLAELNGRIRTTIAGGGTANELIDHRDQLATTIAELGGATVREAGDGTVDVLIDGNAIVSGDSFRAVDVAGGATLATAGDPVRLEWAHRPGSPIALQGGSIAGAVSVLAPSDATGTGGALAEAAADYDAFAVSLANGVNAIHATGATPSGTTSSDPAWLDFFGFTAGLPAARGLVVIPTDGSTIAAAAPGEGPYGGGTADAIAQFGTSSGSPNEMWESFVTAVGVSTRTETQRAELASLAAASATTAQLGNASVDLDEENVNLLAHQHAYQGAARVMTAIDEMLDTLINRTGLVGR